VRHRRRQVDAARDRGLCPPALGHLVTPEERRQAEVVAPPPENVVLDRGGRIGGNLKCREKLASLPAGAPLCASPQRH
jgi:hypothetical protein